MKRSAILIFCLCLFISASAQVPGMQKRTTTKNNSRGADTTIVKNNNKLDTLGFEHRDDLRDSITLTYRFLDSTRRNTLDSSINDFDRYFSVPSTYQYLGNNGAAAFPLIFQPFAKAGFDPGFHAFDVYRFKLEETKIYRTTGPFSSLGYQLAGGKEQMIQALHTQSPKPNMNFGLDYRLISAPGYFVTQNTNHNNIRLFGDYRGKKKRYSATLVLISNTLKASENGGITYDSLLADPNRRQRFSVPVNLGGALPYQPNPLKSSIETGNTYKDVTFYYRHSYDIGKRDSVAVNDSTTEYLFYPKLRIQHTITSATYNYMYRDKAADSAYYKQHYDFNLAGSFDTLLFREKWKLLTNDLSLIQFPDIKNSAQFFLAGVSYQTIKGNLKNGPDQFTNIIAHAEYRNLTRNKLWNILLKAEFYPAGLNSGDYNAYATLGRYFGRKYGDVVLYFNNVNRTPSFIFDARSTFNFANNSGFKKENITSFGAAANNSLFRIAFNNYLITNYAYFRDFYHPAQYSKPINIIQVTGSSTFTLKKFIKLYADAALQQYDRAAPVRVPFVYVRGRLAYERNLYKNLFFSTGLEARYYTPYRANNYSPVLGQFSVQDTLTIKNLPDIDAFAHFRIKGFTAFIRGENLNTVSFQNGFGFTNNNFAAPHYPTQGFMMRVGIRWWFVY